VVTCEGARRARRSIWRTIGKGILSIEREVSKGLSLFLGGIGERFGFVEAVMRIVCSQDQKLVVLAEIFFLRTNAKSAAEGELGI
jgi:hypothetical protein